MACPLYDLADSKNIRLQTDQIQGRIHVWQIQATRRHEAKSLKDTNNVWRSELLGICPLLSRWHTATRLASPPAS